MVFPSVFSTNKIVLGVLFIMVALSWWWSHMEGVLPEAVREVGHVPDYWIDGLVAKTMNAEGRLNRVIMAEHTEHFPDDGSTDIVRPRSFLFLPSPSSNEKTCLVALLVFSVILQLPMVWLVKQR